MRRSSLALVFAFAVLMTMAFPAVAADVNTSSFEDWYCEEGQMGTFHFVLTRHGGADPMTRVLTVNFKGGDTFTGTPDKWNRGTLHWHVEGTGSVASASITGPGWLVLSDVECGDDAKKDHGK